MEAALNGSEIFVLHLSDSEGRLCCRRTRADNSPAAVPALQCVVSDHQRDGEGKKKKDFY